MDIHWHMTPDTYRDYQQICQELIDSAEAGDAIRHEFAKDRLRALPGFPSNMNEDHDRAVPVLTSNPTNRIVTIGSTL